MAFIFISWLRLGCQSCLYLPGLLLAAAFNYYLMTTVQLPIMFVFTWPPAGPAFNYYLVATAWLPLWPTGFGLLVLKVFWTGSVLAYGWPPFFLLKPLTANVLFNVFKCFQNCVSRFNKWLFGIYHWLNKIFLLLWQAVMVFRVFQGHGIKQKVCMWYAGLPNKRDVTFAIANKIKK